MFLCQFVCLWSLSFPGVCDFLLLDSYATFLNLVLVGLCINPFFPFRLLPHPVFEKSGKADVFHAESMGADISLLYLYFFLFLVPFVTMYKCLSIWVSDAIFHFSLYTHKLVMNWQAQHTGCK